MLNIGCTTRAFAGRTVSETARQMHEIGFLCTELCFVLEDLPGFVYNGMGDISSLTPGRVKEAAQVFRDSGVETASLGMYTDLRHPDPAVQAREWDYIRRHIEFAAEAGIPYIASACGFTPGSRGLSADTYEADYSRIRDFLARVCLEAEKSGVHMALEACVLDMIPSPRRLKTLIEELEESTHVRLGALLDPGDLLAAEDEEGMFRHLRHDIYYFHGKDRKIHAACDSSLGDGDVDWVKLMELYIRYTDHKPFILECCNEDSCGESRRRALAYYDEAFHRLLGRIS